MNLLYSFLQLHIHTSTLPYINTPHNTCCHTLTQTSGSPWQRPCTTVSRLCSSPYGVWASGVSSAVGRRPPADAPRENDAPPSPPGQEYLWRRRRVVWCISVAQQHDHGTHQIAHYMQHTARAHTHTHRTQHKRAKAASRYALFSQVFIQHVHRVGGCRLAGAVPGVDGMGGGDGRAVDGGADAVLDRCHCKRVATSMGKSGKIGCFTHFPLPRRFVASGDAIACGIASASCMRWLRMLEDPRRVCAGCGEKEQDRRDC